MKKLQFRVLYREFLFRIVDLELLSAHAEGDSRTLLGQVASILIFFGVVLAVRRDMGRQCPWRRVAPADADGRGLDRGALPYRHDNAGGGPVRGADLGIHFSRSA